MTTETCEYHTLLVADIAVIKNDLQYIKDRLCNHVTEGEKEGGFRDRLLIAEKEIAVIKRGYWKACIVSGLIGGLLSQMTPEAFRWIINLIK